MLFLNFLKQDLNNLKVGAIPNKTMMSYLVRSPRCIQGWHWQRRENMTCVFLGLGYRLWNDCFQIHPFTWEFHNFGSLNSRIRLRFVSVPHFHYPFVSGWTSRLFLFNGDLIRGAMNMDEQLSLEYMAKADRAGSRNRSTPTFLRNLQADFHSGCASLHPQQQWISGISVLSPHPCQPRWPFVSQILAFLIGKRWNLKVVLIAFPWELGMVNLFFFFFSLPAICILCWELSVQFYDLF